MRSAHRSYTVAAASLLLSVSLHAAEKGSHQISLFFGSFSYTVGIEVPPFHGLEPRLALGYSSEGRNGFAGVGWNVAGFSVIERTNAGRGTPRFNSTDAFMLDGQELLACPLASNPPSCTSGGTHSTKIESFLKIVRNTGNDTWDVFGRDGTKTTFSPIVGTTWGTLRWGSTGTVDTKGNSVTYSWACPATGATADCYPDSVAYNGYKVTFFRENRPDTQSFPAVSNMGITLHRLKSVLVQLGTTNIRGYRLTYTTSALSGRSLLASVQVFGRDLVHDGSGGISGGTSLPPQTFAYQQDPAANSGKVFLTPTTGSSGSGSQTLVDWSTQDVTALSGSDYVSAAGTLTFTSSETTKQFTVSVNGDVTAEQNETFLVNLSNATNGASLGNGKAQATILNDDGAPPSVSATPVCVSSGAVSVSVGNGPANASDWVGVYATGASNGGWLDWWHLNGTRTLPGSGSANASMNPTMPSSPGTYEFRFFNGTQGLPASPSVPLATSNVVTVGTCSGTPSLSIGDVVVMEGNSGTTSANFNVTLSSGSTQTVTVSWATANGTASAPGDYASGSGALSFEPGQTVKTVAVSVNGDTVQEGHETFFVNLSSPVNATISDGQGQGTITNDDGGTSSITSSLACVSPSGAVVVSFSGAPGNLTDWVGLYPTGNPDYVNWWSLNGTQTWPSSPIVNGSFTVSVPSTAGTYEFKLRNASSGAVVATSGVQTIGACVSSLSVSDLAVVEGSSGTRDVHFTVQLSAPASQIVSVSWATSAGTATEGTDYLAASSAVTFFTGETLKTVKVAVNGDTASEGNETFFVNLSNAVNAAIADSQGQATILNDDGAATVTALPTCSAAAGTVTVSVMGGPGNTGDEVRIYPTAGGTYADWWFLNGTKTQPGTGLQNATFNVTLPASAGDYELRLIQYSTQQLLATSPVIKIGTCAPTLSIGDLTFLEGDSGERNASFSVWMAPASTQIVSVSYQTVNGTAAAGDDYSAKSSQLTLNPGETAKSVLVPIPDLLTYPLPEPSGPDGN